MRKNAEHQQKHADHDHRDKAAEKDEQAAEQPYIRLCFQHAAAARAAHIGSARRVMTFVTKTPVRIGYILLHKFTKACEFGRTIPARRRGKVGGKIYRSHFSRTFYSF